MAKKNRSVPQYGTVTRKGILYYRTRIQDADGKQVSLYATTCEELYEKQLAAKKQVEEILFRRKHPTVAEYCEKWLLMQSAKVSSATMKGYTSDMRNYIIKPLGDMYMEEVTADDIRLALVPLTKKSEGLERFWDNTRWMIEFSVLRPSTAYGSPGEEMRLFLTEDGYQAALQSQQRREIKIKRYARVIEGHILDFKPGKRRRS